VFSAVIVAALVLSAVLLLPPLWSAAALSVLLLLVAWEWSGLLRTQSLFLRAVFIVTVVVASAVLWRLTRNEFGLRVALAVSISFWTVAVFWVAFLPQQMNATLVWCAGVIALSLAWLALVRMRTDWAQGQYWVLYSLLIVWVADSGAFFAGKRWGVRKLAPLVSPGKTWVGLVGGLVATAALAIVAAIALHVSIPKLVLLTVLVALYSAIGDLTESLFKRFAGLKDSGTLIPGHGGVLDRFDSLLAAAPALMLGAILLGASP
jgi:phosphatidate cytidylyltransferase